MSSVSAKSCFAFAGTSKNNAFSSLLMIGKPIRSIEVFKLVCMSVSPYIIYFFNFESCVNLLYLSANVHLLFINY